MIVVPFIAALIIALCLAYAGLVKKQLQVSHRKTITGRSAGLIGACCLAFALVMLVAVILLTYFMMLGRAARMGGSLDDFQGFRLASV